jgi:hypothetical protein
MKELLSNILEEAFDTKSTLGQLLEIKSSSLEKLGKEKVLDVMTNFPVEMVRIFYQALEDEGMKIKGTTIQQDVQRFAEYTKIPGMSSKNPWLDTNNRNEFEFTDENTKDNKGKGTTIKIEIKLKGTEAQWGIDARYFRQITTEESQPIKLTNLSAQDFAKQIASTAKKIITTLPPTYDLELKDIKLAKKGLVKEAPAMVNRLKPLGRIYLIDIFGAKDKEIKGVDILEFIPSFTKFGIGWPEEDNKVPWDEINKNWSWSSNNKFREFTYTFQTQLLVEALPKIFKRLRENNMFVTKGYMDHEKIVLQLSKNVEPSARYPERGSEETYATIDAAYEKRFTAQAEKLHSQALPMTLEEFKRIIIVDALNPELKKERRK